MHHDLGILYRCGGVTNVVILTPISMYSRITLTKSASFRKTSFTTWRPSHKSLVIAAIMQADEKGHIHRSDFRDILIYVQTTSRTLYLCYEPRLAEVTNASSWRLCWINSAPPGTILITHFTMEAAVSSQTSVHVYQILLHHIPDDSRIVYGLTCTCIIHEGIWGVDIWPQSFWIFSLDGVSGQFHNPAALSPDTERQIKLKRRVGVPRVGMNVFFLPCLGSNHDSQVVQPVAYLLSRFKHAN
jgi:hypothetical protein